MTGKDDRLSPWKIVIAGFAGAGKTLFASTAPSPLFVFFTQKPKIKSIADRYVPHVKLTNKVDGAGNLVETAQDQLKMLITDLDIRFTLGEPVEYETLVIDTGDELQQVMKESRRIRNRGEWGPGDWVWLADAYKTLMEAVIDLPMNIIALYHITNSQDGIDGGLYRELDLQGASQDQVPNWFDVVAALDTFETSDEQGNIESQRVLLTHSSRMYPWVKDHSGNLPPRWPISDNFVGDYQRLIETLRMDRTGPIMEGQEHQVIGTIGTTQVPGPGPATGLKVPKPQDLAAKKEEKAKPAEKPADDPFVEAENNLREAGIDFAEDQASEPIVPTQEPEPRFESGGDEQSAEDEPQVIDLLESETVAETVVPDVQVTNGQFVCAWEKDGEHCQVVVDDEDMREISQIRFRGLIYCRPHFKEALQQQ